jgi:hypothetical protein
MADLRARLTAQGTSNPGLNGPGEVLRPTNGIVFPFTPNIATQSQVEYTQYDLVHTNYQPYAYSKTRAPSLQITGAFTNQTREDFEYTVGVLHFLKCNSKMFFGDDSEYAGAPPPLLNFSAYGMTNFKNVPVLIGSFTMSYPDDVDYVEGTVDGEPVKLPAVMTVAIDLLPHYSARKQRQFSLAEFSNGNLYKDGFI